MSHALATVRHDGRRPSVTPGEECQKNPGALKGRKIAAVASAAATIFRLSVAALRLEGIFLCHVPGADAPGYKYAAASRLFKPSRRNAGSFLRVRVKPYAPPVDEVWRASPLPSRKPSA
jgi:hypothetical protein